MTTDPMPLEKQVCSLELSKRLKELGVKQEGAFILDFYFESGVAVLHGWPGDVRSANKNLCIQVPTFTVAELGEMLPPDTPSSKTESKEDFSFWCGMASDEDGNTYWDKLNERTPLDYHNFWASNEADARAKMLIYLIEKGLVAK